ncbi:putative trafficking protein particle complex subunit 9 [Apostichopus japonicus]|uniref:Putative trafficking protein particle complex subunit 9 n=1 Tax=Stichopus japonicus TaxID=307972 RepID=A0A2G8JW61_STIJA|nr:putative trafficking protein particle complex subunit 9 [Apostichopus japonicus]
MDEVNIVFTSKQLCSHPTMTRASADHNEHRRLQPEGRGPPVTTGPHQALWTTQGPVFQPGHGEDHERHLRSAASSGETRLVEIQADRPRGEQRLGRVPRTQEDHRPDLFGESVLGDQLANVYANYKTLKDKYNSSLYDSRCFVFGMLAEEAEKTSNGVPAGVFLFENVEECEQLEDRVKDFGSSLFWVLESKRLERLKDRSVNFLSCGAVRKEGYGRHRY